MLSYGLLMVNAFLAATIFPFFSEALLAILITEGKSAVGLLCVASLGNTLGAAVNWALGRYLLKFQTHRWFPFKANRLVLAERWFQKYGVWSLLFAWLPIIGDALTFIAGILRVNFWLFLVLTAIGKTLRYAVVIALTMGLLKL